jgi:CubicO group peptidase (beta-lactamase class C family)
MNAGDLLRHTSGLPDHLHMEPFATEMAARVAALADPAVAHVGSGAAAVP